MQLADFIVVTGFTAQCPRRLFQRHPGRRASAPANVAVIIDETADPAVAAEKIAASKTFDNATSCSSEKSSSHHRKRLHRNTRRPTKSRRHPPLPPPKKPSYKKSYGLTAPSTASSSPATCRSLPPPPDCRKPSPKAASSWSKRNGRRPPTSPTPAKNSHSALTLYRAADFAGRQRKSQPAITPPRRRPLRRHPHRRRNTTTGTRPHPPRLSGNRQPSPLLRQRRQLRQRPPLLPIDGLRQLGRQQHLRQPQPPPLHQHRPRHPPHPTGRTHSGRPIRRLPQPLSPR